MGRRQHEGIAAGDHHVLDFRTRGQVGDRRVPARGIGLEARLADGIGVTTDRVAAGAETAIDRAHIERQEQCLVMVAVGKPRGRRVGLFVQRIEREPRVIRQLRGGDRHELDPDRVGIGILPVDPADRVRREAQVHRRTLDAGTHILEELARDQRSKRLLELVDGGDALLVLELVIEESRTAHLPVGGYATPELGIVETAMVQRSRFDRRFQRRRYRRVLQGLQFLGQLECMRQGTHGRWAIARQHVPETRILQYCSTHDSLLN